MKRVKVLALVMVFAFAALGGAYALWFDTLYIEETVTTGNVDVKWHEVCGSDWGCNYEVHGVYGGSLDSMDPGNPNESKNIGCKDRVISEDGNTLSMTLRNGYPGYQEYVTAQIKNVGTIPVKFMLKLTADANSIIYDEVTNPNGWLIVDFRTVGAGGDELEGNQLNPGKIRHIRIVQRVRQIAPQNATATFEYTIQAVQWNEYGFYPLPDTIQTDRVVNDKNEGFVEGPFPDPAIPWDAPEFTATP